MQYINNNSDFSLDIALKAILPDGAELATAPPNCDFTLTFGTRYDEAKYEVGRYNGEPRGYTVNADGSLHVIFDAHGLGLGRLGCMLTYVIPDSSYPDGEATVTTSYELDVELIGWGADGQQSGTVTLATEAAAVSAAQQAQAAAEQAAGKATSAVGTANEAKTIAQKAEQSAEMAVAASKDSKAQAEASAHAAEASRQAAEQSASQAAQAQQAATAAAGEAAQSAEAVRQSATAAAQSAEQAAQAATSAAQAVERADSATESATAAAQAATNAATNANTAATNASQYADRYEDIANSLPIVTPDFEGAENDKGLRYVVRKNKLIAILKDGHVEYAPEGLIYVDTEEAFSIVLNKITFNFPIGKTYTVPSVAIQNQMLFSLFAKTPPREVKLTLETSKATWLFRLFWECKNLQSVDISSFDTSMVADMGYMFSGCSSLAALDVSGWDTAACTSMGYMFSGCSSLAALDVSGWDTAACTSMGSMFYGCSSLAALDVSGWDTAACTSMGSMFYGCKQLASLDPSKWNTEQCTNMNGLFCACESLIDLDLTGFTMTNVTDVRYMFFKAYAPVHLKFPNMGQLKADTDYNKSIDLSYSPLDKASLDSIFAYDRTANGLTNPLTVQLSKTSKALLSAEDIAAITAKGYTIV